VVGLRELIYSKKSILRHVPGSPRMNL